MDVGVLAGAAVVVSATDTPIGPDGCAYADSCLEQDETSTYGMGILSLGFFL